MDMSSKTAICTGKTSLITSVLSSDVLPSKVKVTVPTSNTSDESTALIVLTLREERSTNTPNTSDGTLGDVVTLRSSSNVPFFIERLEPILAVATPS